MAFNLVNLLENEFSNDVVEKVAAFIGEAPAQTRSALTNAVSAVIAALQQQASTPRGSTELFGVLPRAGFDGASIESLPSVVGSPGGLANLIKTGGPLVASLFGSRLSGDHQLARRRRRHRQVGGILLAQSRHAPGAQPGGPAGEQHRQLQRRFDRRPDQGSGAGTGRQRPPRPRPGPGRRRGRGGADRRRRGPRRHRWGSARGGVVEVGATGTRHAPARRLVRLVVRV